MYENMYESDSDDSNPESLAAIPDRPLYQAVVPVLEGCTYENFYEYQLERKLPCIIQRVGLNWKATELWVNQEKPNFKYLRSKYAGSMVTVYNCKEKCSGSHQTSQMRFRDYLNYWEKYNKAEDKSEMDLLYLKDWHMRNEYKDDEFYEVPPYFSSDWLNEYLVAMGKDDYRFVYMGPSGSWTPLHKDVLNSFSWSVNICGYKKWLLFPAGEETKLKDKFGNLPFSVDEIPDNVIHYYVTQRPGDAIFVPSGWYHQVWNLEDTISINHNWINANNIFEMLSVIFFGYEEVKEELCELEKEENYLSECQKVLRTHVGMNHDDFFEFLRFISLTRLRKHAFSTQREESELVKEMLLKDLKGCQEILTMGWIEYLRPEYNKEAKIIGLQLSNALFNKL